MSEFFNLNSLKGRPGVEPAHLEGGGDAAADRGGGGVGRQPRGRRQGHVQDDGRLGSVQSFIPCINV